MPVGLRYGVEHLILTRPLGRLAILAFPAIEVPLVIPGNTHTRFRLNAGPWKEIYFEPPSDQSSSNERISSMWIHSAMRTAFFHSRGFFPDSILNSSRSTPYLSREEA